MPEAIYTIGHSDHSAEHFIGLLQFHRVEIVGDVRSTPYSRMNPQFNRENLRRPLSNAGIAYMFLGRELGARSEDPGCYVEGRVRYDLLAKTDLFRSGIEKVRGVTMEHRMALMCAEKDPMECHRTLLVSRYLDGLGIQVRHILADAELLDHGDLVTQLRERLHLPERDLFRSPAEILDDAYRIQGERIAFVQTK